MTLARSAPRYAVLFDGSCSVCRRSIRRLEAWDKDGALELVESAEPEVARRFPWISPAAFDRSVQVVRIADGKTWQGAAAIEELLGVLPRGRAVSWLFHLPFARAFGERLYRFIAAHRYRFGCTDHCRTT